MQGTTAMVIPCIFVIFATPYAANSRRNKINIRGIFLGRHSYKLETVTKSDGQRLTGCVC